MIQIAKAAAIDGDKGPAGAWSAHWVHSRDTHVLRLKEVEDHTAIGPCVKLAVDRHVHWLAVEGRRGDA